MTGLLQRCGWRLFDFYRQFDATLPTSRPFLAILEERPFLNLSLLRGLMIRWGLPTRLVTDNVGGSDLGDIPARFGQIRRKLPVHLRLAVHQWQAQRSTRQCEERLEQLARGLEGLSAPELFERFCDIYVGLVHQMMALTAGMSLPLSALRVCGTLAEHNARFQVESSAMLWDRHLSQSQYLERYGHRGPFESDLARPRIAENPEPWLAALENLDPPPIPPLSWKGRLSQPLAWWAAPLVRARERLRSNAMRSFQRVRQQIQSLVEQSPYRETLLCPMGEPPLPRFWSLTPEELAGALREPLSEDFWAERAEEISRLQALQVPDLISNFGWSPRPAQDGDTLRGIPLTRGQVRGQAWVLREPTSERPAHLSGPVILVARAVDPGWLASFAWADGVAIETGGDLSHGSILLRELGLPAVTNIGGLWGWVQDGEQLELDADRGQIRRRPARAVRPGD
jgi:pyruvate,water dikinase